MISIALAEKLNKIICRESGGLSGIRDLTLLSSALGRPFATFEGVDLYKNAVEKSSAILESIIINHPFVDGNKRMGYAFMRMLLAEEGLGLSVPEDEIYNFIISVSKGELRYEKIKNWIENNTSKS